LVLLRKGINYEVKPTSIENKPTWLVEEHQGKLPAIVHKGKVVTDSLSISEYLEKKYPHSSLTRQGAYSYQEVIEKTAGFFPSLVTYIKNKDSSKDPELLEQVDKQLEIIDEILRTTPGQYLGGIEMTLADLYLLPQLFHAYVTMEHFKGVEFFHLEGDFVRPALESYMARMLDLEEFNNKKAYVGVDQVVYGWKVARGEA
jgi:glutathione S-transferase